MNKKPFCYHLIVTFYLVININLYTELCKVAILGLFLIKPIYIKVLDAEKAYVAVLAACRGVSADSLSIPLQTSCLQL